MKRYINSNLNVLRLYERLCSPTRIRGVNVSMDYYLGFQVLKEGGIYEERCYLVGAILAIADPGGNYRMRDFTLPLDGSKHNSPKNGAQVHQLAFTIARDDAFIPELLFGVWPNRPFFAYNSPKGWTVILLLSDYVSLLGYDVLSKYITEQIPSMVPISPTTVIKAPVEFKGYRYAINLLGNPLIAANLLNTSQTEIIKSHVWQHGGVKDGVNRGTCWF